MWEYRWVEVELGSDDTTLRDLGRQEWEAVSSTLTGESFGRKWVAILLKREAAPRSIDVGGYEAKARRAPGRR